MGNLNSLVVVHNLVYKPDVGNVSLLNVRVTEWEIMSSKCDLFLTQWRAVSN